MVLPAYKAAHPDITVKLVAQGSGAAIAMAQAGNADVLLVHSPAMATRLHYELPALREALAKRLGEPVDKILLRVRPTPTGP